MKEIAVFGEEQFVLGFQLSGIKKIFVAQDNPKEQISSIIGYPEIGLVIMQTKMMDNLDDETKELVTKSIEPIFLTLSRKDSNEEMQRLIKKSIGIDVWNKGD
ncbi:MAG: V-type ATP synthase subunit F [Candidatus Woesearchaeota archaeon]